MNMTNLEHLEAAEGCLRNDGRHTLAHVVQDACEEITDLRRVVGNRRGMQFVDATPDADLPRRILASYIDESHTISDPPALAEMMNGWQSERNAILRAAIAKL